MQLDALTAALLSEAAETRAMVSLFGAAPAELSARLGLRIEQVDDATLLLCPGLPDPMFNRAIGLGLQQGVRTEALRDLLARAAAAGVSSWWLHGHPLGRPDNWQAVLPQMGFTRPRRGRWAKFLRDCQPLASASGRVRLAGEDELAQTLAICVRAFDMPEPLPEWLLAAALQPDWRVFCWELDGQVAGAALMHLGDDVAWLGLGAVEPAYRGRGGQAALLAARIDHAAQAGCAWVASETGEPVWDEPNPSLNNLLAAGFRCVASRRNWLAPG